MFGYEVDVDSEAQMKKKKSWGVGGGGGGAEFRVFNVKAGRTWRRFERFKGLKGFLLSCRNVLLPKLHVSCCAES